MDHRRGSRRRAGVPLRAGGFETRRRLEACPTSHHRGTQSSPSAPQSANDERHPHLGVMAATTNGAATDPIVMLIWFIAEPKANSEGSRYVALALPADGTP